MIPPSSWISSEPDLLGHGLEDSGDGLLVSTSISQQNRWEIYGSKVKVIRPGTGNQDLQPPDRSGKELQGFSSKSRSRLRDICEDSAIPLISQFGLTYHQDWPTDGRVAKKHLNAWLTTLRRKAPGVGYLWLLEFQQRGAPHFHVFLTIPPDPDLRADLAAAWCNLTGAGMSVHDHSNNWISWDMYSSGYLTKYLDKDAQKCIPEGYSNFGRFWGNSRNIKPVPQRVLTSKQVEDLAVIDEDTGEIQGGESTIIRWLGRFAEKKTKGYSRFRTRAPHGSYSVRGGSKIFEQIEKYWHQQQPPSPF